MCCDVTAVTSQIKGLWYMLWPNQILKSKYLRFFLFSKQCDVTGDGTLIYKSLLLSRDMKFGIHQSVETLHIEAELGSVQQKAAKLTAKRTELLSELQKWSPQMELNGSTSTSDKNNIKNTQPPKTVRMVKR